MSDSHDAAICDFKKVLNQYTIKACCGRPYVRVSKLTEWLRSKYYDKWTQADRLLEAAYRHRVLPALPINREELCDGEDCCLILFSILLDLGRGELINQLRRQDKVDRHFPINLLELTRIFRDMNIEDADMVAEAFDRLQWKFFPARLDLGAREYPPNRVLPFCRKAPINDKGGTAQLFQIEVLEEFVSPKLREAVEQSRYENDDDKLGPRYEFALKTFEDGNRALYLNEVNAFYALKNQNAMIKYLGEFGHKEKRIQKSSGPSQQPDAEDQKPTFRVTHNILLEYGESDLEEYFVDKVPPYLQPEIEAFWAGLFAVADAVKGIHLLKLPSSGKTQEYYGWHADIKPDNILIVHGNFKLADPGFTKWVKKTDQVPKELLRGGTETYGAPERHAGWTNTPSKVAQTIDTWSLACVFSVVATWVVLGYQGIRQYKDIRKVAIRQIAKEQKRPQASKSNSPGLSHGDYFHDGSDVLPAVKEWHNVLRDSIRPTDTVTGRVLDLVDQKMLLGDAGQRIKADQICEELKSILGSARGERRVVVHESIEELLRQVDDAAPLPSKARDSTTAAAGNSTLAPPGSIPEGPKTIAQERKSKFLGPPLQKTTHRSQVLRSVTVPQEAQPLPVVVDPPTIQQPTSIDPPAEKIGVLDESQGSPLHPTESPESYPYQESHNVYENSHRNSDPVSARPRLQLPRRSTTSCRKNAFQIREECDRRGRQKDKELSRHYGNRDIKFLVDNADTMERYWGEAKYLLEALLLKAQDQDENGMDLFFTSGSVKVQGKESRSKFLGSFKDNPFTAAMNNPGAQPIKNNPTDMRKPLSKIFDAYLDEARRAKRGSLGHESRDLTLLVLTDGLWDGMRDKEGVKDLIVKFVKALRDIVGVLKINQRPVSIEFIQFGDNEDATYRLWTLDNELVYEGIPDIVDTEKSNGDVMKMLLGSFVEKYDLDEDDEIPDTPKSPDYGYNSTGFIANPSPSPNRGSTVPASWTTEQTPRASVLYGTPTRVPTVGMGGMMMRGPPPMGQRVEFGERGMR